MTRLTKAQLLAKIEQLEHELGLATETVGELQRELHAYQVVERPSRREHSRSHDFAHTVPMSLPIVMLRGVPHTKQVAWEHGRRVATYTPVR